MNIAILGAGGIAEQMATAVNGLAGEVNAYAVASRSYDKAKKFADKWHFDKAYGSYEELVKDDKVDLIYIATPHAMHYENAKLCVENGKAVLVEKAFTANAKQARELLELGRKNNVLIVEAMWTRFIPTVHTIKEIIASGKIGEVVTVEADFSIPICTVPRLHDPALAGGALLDLGVYTLTFASIFMGNDVLSTDSTCMKYETGVDATAQIVLHYAGGKAAYLRTSMVSGNKNEGRINGTKGYIQVSNINNFEEYTIYDSQGKQIQNIRPGMLVNGYEYEVLACKEALQKGMIECPMMPHHETLYIMEQMDSLRAKWGVAYPFEK